MTPTAAEARPRHPRANAVREAVRTLRQRLELQVGADKVLVDFLDDDLREGQRALQSVEEYLDGILEVLADPESRAIDLVDAADGERALEDAEYLAVVLANLRRRVLKLAVHLQARR